MEEISVLIAQAQAGDNGAREVLIEKNLGLVHHIVKRFSGRGYDMAVSYTHLTLPTKS